MTDHEENWTMQDVPLRDTDELLRRIREALEAGASDTFASNKTVLNCFQAEKALDQLTAILNERLLPVIPAEWHVRFICEKFHTEVERYLGWTCAIVKSAVFEVQSDHAFGEGKTPRAAVLAAISRIEGEKA